MLFQKAKLKLIFTLLISVSISIGGSGVRGMVTNSYGFPLAGVIVRALEAEKGEYCWSTSWSSRRMTTTDSDGFYSIDLPTGYHSMYITLDSIVSRPGSVVLVTNAYLDLNFSEEIVPNEPGSISGLVTDQSGTPLEGACVLAQTTGIRVRTDSSGRYIITDLPPGFHTLEASLLGMRSVTNDSIWVFPEGESECNFDTASGRSLPDTTGYITGIVETSFGGPAIHCTVMVIGTSLGSMTDSTGAYRIRFFNPGKYKLRASYIGYSPAYSPIIKIVAGDEVEYNFDPNSFLENDSTGGALRLGPHSGTDIVVTDSRGSLLDNTGCVTGVEEDTFSKPTELSTNDFATICGTVVNGEAGARQSPIFGATILAIGWDSLSDTYPFPANSETTSDSLGRYKLSLIPGVYNVTATFNGEIHTVDGFVLNSADKVTQNFRYYPNYEPFRITVFDNR